MRLTRLQAFLVLMSMMFVVAGNVQASATRIDGAFSREALSQKMEVLEDPGGKMDFAAIRASTAFRPAPKTGTNFGFTRSAWWIRFSLDNPGDEDRHVVLREDYPLIDHLDLWAAESNETCGTPLPGIERPFPRASSTTAIFCSIWPCPPDPSARSTFARSPTGPWIWI